MIYLAADHRGLKLKEAIKKFLEDEDLSFEDVGAFIYEEKDDYVDFAKTALEKIGADIKNNKGVFLCGSGHGMDMVANKYKGMRSAMAFNTEVAIQSREHEDANVLVLASDWLEEDEATEIVKIWLETPFTGEERHVRRLKKMGEIEQNNFK